MTYVSGKEPILPDENPYYDSHDAIRDQNGILRCVVDGEVIMNGGMTQGQIWGCDHGPYGKARRLLIHDYYQREMMRAQLAIVELLNDIHTELVYRDTETGISPTS